MKQQYISSKYRKHSRNIEYFVIECLYENTENGLRKGVSQNRTEPLCYPHKRLIASSLFTFHRNEWKRWIVVWRFNSHGARLIHMHRYLITQ